MVLPRPSIRQTGRGEIGAGIRTPLSAIAMWRTLRTMYHVFREAGTLVRRPRAEVPETDRMVPFPAGTGLDRRWKTAEGPRTKRTEPLFGLAKSKKWFDVG